MIQPELLIHAQWVLPMDDRQTLWEDHAVAVDQGRIRALLPSAEAQRTLQPKREVHLPGHVLLPGFINAHTHAPMTLLRGLADDLPLMTWLREHIWPAEQRWVNEAMVEAGSRLAVLEMLRGGTVCFNDMYFFPEATARAVEALGIRAVLGMILVDLPTRYAKDPAQYLEKGMALYERYAEHPRIHTALAPHAPYSVSDSALVQAGALARELQVPLHIHLQETREEMQQSRREHGGKTPLARLRALGLVGPNLIAVHMTQLEMGDLEILRDGGVSVVHCPESNLKLASGFCPVARLQREGIHLALGTDGAASNDDLDMLGELRTAALLAKGVSGDAAALPAYEALRMATLHGAKALGLEAETGSLEVGKSADLIAIDLRAPNTQPIHHPISQLVYAATRDQIRQVWVAGRHLVRDGEPQLDVDAILEEARAWGLRIASTDP